MVLFGTQRTQLGLSTRTKRLPCNESPIVATTELTEAQDYERRRCQIQDDSKCLTRAPDTR